MKQLHIHALGVNVGGGFVLLEQLLQHDNGSLGFVYLDDRTRSKLKNKNDNIYFYKHSLINEYKSQKKLRDSVGPNDHVLFFSNRPPLIKFPCKVSVFHQNALLLTKLNWLDVKSKLNLIWLKIFKSNTDQFIVQNQTMRRLLSKHGCHNTAVVNAAFFDMENNYEKTDGDNFIYVSSSAEHKNHKNLIKAWEYLLYNGLKKRLTLVTSGECKDLIGIINQSPAREYIDHKKDLSREQILQEYKNHKALVFPSRIESLGLPLLEAKACGLAVIASERDYVRDIIDPDQSFDPNSYISIARSLMRFLDFDYNKSQVLSSEEFINKLLEKTKVSARKAS